MNSDAKIVVNNAGNSTENIKIKLNKELLIVTLLEYICNIHHKQDMFYNICDSLVHNGILTNDKLYSLDFNSSRNICMNIINTLIYHDSNKIEHIKEVDHKCNYESRYNNDFIEVEHLGKGGFGSVYKVLNKLDKMCYAIKKIPIEQLLHINNDKSSNYLHEVQYLAKLNHPNIVRYYGTWIELGELLNYGNEVNDSEVDSSEVDSSEVDSSEVDSSEVDSYEVNSISDNSVSSNEISTDSHSTSNSTSSTNSNDSSNLSNNDNLIVEYIDDTKLIPILHIQMELCFGTLENYLIKRNYNGTLNIKTDFKIIEGIINGLKYIHEMGIIHGDITPSNIFLNDTNVKIGDFGLAKKHEKYTEMIETNSYGNAIYTAPERYEQHICCLKSDIYSFGIVFFELVYPFKTMMERVVTIENIKNGEYTGLVIINKEVSDKVINFIKCMISHDINERIDIMEVEKVFHMEKIFVYNF